MKFLFLYKTFFFCNKINISFDYYFKGSLRRTKDNHKEIRLQVVNWQIIIEKHGAIVWHTAYRLLGNHSDASDCFQETFISAIKVCKRQKVKNFPALLARLATTRAIDMLRVRLRSDSDNITIDYNHDTLSNSIDPANYIQKQELAMQLKNAIVQLPDQEAQVFCMRYLNDMSYRQIAKELDIKTNVVGVILYRAKDKLKKSLSFLQNQQKSEVIP